MNKWPLIGFPGIDVWLRFGVRDKIWSRLRDRCEWRVEDRLVKYALRVVALDTMGMGVWERRVGGNGRGLCGIGRCSESDGIVLVAGSGERFGDSGNGRDEVGCGWKGFFEGSGSGGKEICEGVDSDSKEFFEGAGDGWKGFFWCSGCFRHFFFTNISSFIIMSKIGDW